MPSTDTTEKRLEMGIVDFLLLPADAPVCLNM